MIPQDKLPPGNLFPAMSGAVATAQITGIRLMCSQAVMHLHNPARETSHTILTGLMKRLGSSLFARNRAQAPPVADSDPYALILLADQEFGEGRDEQARYLVDAAYEAFDQHAKCTIYRLHSTT